MPLNFLFGTILLGGIALKDKVDREYAKDLAAKQEEYYKESERRETARRTEKFPIHLCRGERCIIALMHVVLKIQFSVQEIMLCHL